MRGGRITRIMLFCAAAGMASPLRAAECQGSIGPRTSIVGRTGYDPFNPADLADDFSLSISNTGAAPCGYALLFRSRAVHPVLGGTLTYDLTSQTGGSLLTNAPATLAPMAPLGAPLAPGGTGAIAFQLVIPRGQFAAPDTYRDTLDLELYALDANGRAASSALQTATLAIAYTVPRVLSVNIKGGETATTLAFGALASGQQRTVAIEARSNQTYQLDVSSDNHGALALTPKLPGETWSVPYSVTFAGQPLNLAGAAGLYSLPATRPESDASYSLTVTIGDVAQKRAGRYKDVITVEIKAAIP
jgi:hypothetical protein